MATIPQDYVRFKAPTVPDGITPEAIIRANAIYEIAKKKTKLDFQRIPLDDEKTWKLIQSGMTKGVFQLEKQLGKRYCKEIAPTNINELSDVISLIRPGCLEGDFREKPDEPGEFSSITNTYIKIKNGTWPPEYIHKCLEPILSETFSVPIYQEQIMRICSDFAGFTLKEADVMRKAVGKKKKDLMDTLKQKFIDGAVTCGHNEQIAEQIFGWIEDFSGYGFNKSHGVSYAMIAYRTAYAKAHYPLEFFKAMLTNSEGKQDTLEEIEELVHEARYFGIKILPPILQKQNVDFAKVDNKTISFGLGHIKGVGSGAVGQLEKVSKAKGENDFLKLCFEKSDQKTSTGKMRKSVTVRSNVADALIKSGALDYLTDNRIKLLASYKLLGFFTLRERDFVFNKMEEGMSVKAGYLALLDSKIPNKTRKPKIMDFADDLNRSLAGNLKRMRIAFEKHYLGIPLSGSLVELYSNPLVSIKCCDFAKLPDGTSGCMGVVITKIKNHKDKNHNQMCFLTVSDETYYSDSVVVFSSFYNKISWILEEGKPVLITGKKNRGSFLVKDITHL